MRQLNSHGLTVPGSVALPSLQQDWIDNNELVGHLMLVAPLANLQLLPAQNIPNGFSRAQLEKNRCILSVKYYASKRGWHQRMVRP